MSRVVFVSGEGGGCLSRWVSDRKKFQASSITRDIPDIKSDKPRKPHLNDSFSGWKMTYNLGPTFYRGFDIRGWLSWLFFVYVSPMSASLLYIYSQKDYRTYRICSNNSEVSLLFLSRRVSLWGVSPQIIIVWMSRFSGYLIGRGLSEMA